MSTYIPSVFETVIAMIGLMICACLLAHLKKPRPEGRDEQLHARHRRIRERQLGEAYREDGFTRCQLLFCITGVLGAHVALVIGYLITCAVFGIQEPRW